MAFGDIEGVWTFIYFSYKEGRAVAFTQFGNDDPRRSTLSATNPEVAFLRFTLGGKHLDYPGLNGQFAMLALKLGQGAFIEELQQLKQFQEA